ncbi:unnamed protein product [Porites evermanni]|uniref:Uncharacterized protein n=1 Tax=Porites evermanni TaxID=104178 RepID=A0ABN8RHT9_9CNID|nr:unnamed protein product [Porites evermanni]
MLHGLERTNVRLRIPANIKKHYEAPQIVNILSHGNYPVISPVSFPSILPWSRAVISPPTLTRFWYRRAYHVFNVFKRAKKARTPRGKYINSESKITLTPVKKADNN